MLKVWPVLVRKLDCVIRDSVSYACYTLMLWDFLFVIGLHGFEFIKLLSGCYIDVPTFWAVDLSASRAFEVSDY
jgi:hypothetical protein